MRLHPFATLCACACPLLWVACTGSLASTSPQPTVLSTTTFPEPQEYVDGVPQRRIPVSNLAFAGDTLLIRARILAGTEWPPRTALTIHGRQITVTMAWHYIQSDLRIPSGRPTYFEVHVGPLPTGLYRVTLQQSVDSVGPKVTWRDSVTLR